MSEEVSVPQQDEIQEQPVIITRPPAGVMDHAIPIAIIIVVLVLDQWLKFWIKDNMVLHEDRPLIGDWAHLHFVENNGIAFGLQLPGIAGKILLTSFRLIAATIIFGILIRLIGRRVNRGLIISGALVFAGATGNIIDSIFYGKWFASINEYPGGFFQGKVVDMLYFPIVQDYYPDWVPFVGGNYFEFFSPVFNIADSSITVGILLIIFFYRKSLKSL